MTDRPGNAPAPGESGGPAGDPVVPDAARAVLSRMRASARSAPPAPSPAGGAAPRNRKRPPGGFSGPRPDDRDPVQLGAAWRVLIDDRGWATELRGASLFGLWDQIVGPVNAQHAVPESFDAQTGRLVVRTSSTAWSEQLRLMMPVLRQAIEARLGVGVVREIQISGPAAPRVRGRLRVRGRGPRDTYG